MVSYAAGPEIFGDDVHKRATQRKGENASEIKGRLRALTPDFFYVLRKCLIDFRMGHGAYPNLFNPLSFSEKIQYRKLFDRRPVLVTLADKYAVRDFVRDRVGSEILTEIYHVTDNPRDVPLSALPDRFIVKPTHGCGWLEIVRDKSQLDVERLQDICADWLARNFFYTAGEWVYKNIRPRLIYEELLDDGRGDVPYDYKFFVFNGRVEFLGVDLDRFGDHRRNMYDRDWNKLNFGFQRSCSDKVIERPGRLEDMIAYAEAICEGFDFLRIDMYCIGDRIVFGEVTTTPASGLEPFWPGGTDRWIGDLWKMKR
jgi:hypothetical protein